MVLLVPGLQQAYSRTHEPKEGCRVLEQDGLSKEGLLTMTKQRIMWIEMAFCAVLVGLFFVPRTMFVVLFPVTAGWYLSYKANAWLEAKRHREDGTE